MSKSEEVQREFADKDDEALSLEERLKRLEAILLRLEQDDVALEESLGLFEEGVSHVRDAERILAKTELRVQELLSNGDVQDMELD